MAEVGNAVDYVRAQGGSVPWDAVSQQIEAGRSMADYPDSATSKDWFPEELAPSPPNVVRATCVEEFAMVYEALGYIHGGIDPSKVNADITHENAHNARADYIGFRQSVLGLTITDSVVHTRSGFVTGIGFSWRPFSEQAGLLVTATKLGVAAMIAAPYKPSDSDFARLHVMGYAGQEDVANRILTSTDPRLSSLPLPEPFSFY